MSWDYTDFGQAGYYAEAALQEARLAGRYLAMAHRARKKLQIIQWARYAESYRTRAKEYQHRARDYWRKATRA